MICFLRHYQAYEVSGRHQTCAMEQQCMTAASREDADTLDPKTSFKTGRHCHLGPAAAACGSRPSPLALAGMDGGFLLRQVAQSPALRTLLCASRHIEFRRWRVTAARHVPPTSSCLAASVASPGYCPNQPILAQEDEATPPQPNPPLHAQPRATPRAHRGLLPTHGGSF